MLELFIIVFAVCFLGYLGYLAYQHWFKKHILKIQDEICPPDAIIVRKDGKVPDDVRAMKYFSAAQWRISDSSSTWSPTGSLQSDRSISVFQPPPLDRIGEDTVFKLPHVTVTSA